MNRPWQDREAIHHDDGSTSYYMRRSTWPTRAKASYESFITCRELGYEQPMPVIRSWSRYLAVALVRVVVRCADDPAWPLIYTVEVPRGFPGAEPYWRHEVKW